LSFVEFHLGNVERALDLAGQAHALYPYGQAALTNLAFAQRSSGRLDEALANAQEAVRLSPKSDLPHFILGVCYLDLGQVAKGTEELQAFVNYGWERAYVQEYLNEARAFLQTLP
jgi:tetratricopeptide (TPR) repeat protein